MDKKLKGDISEAFVIAESIKRGFNVSIPFGDRYTYDLIIEKDNRFVKIQIKTVYLGSDNILKCAGSRRTLTNRVKTKVKFYSKNDFDFVIGYYVETNDYYIIPAEIYLTSSTEFRLSQIGQQRSMKHNPSLFLNNWDLI